MVYSRYMNHSLYFQDFYGRQFYIFYSSNSWDNGEIVIYSWDLVDMCRYVASVNRMMGSYESYAGLMDFFLGYLRFITIGMGLVWGFHWVLVDDRDYYGTSLGFMVIERIL